MVGEVSYAEFGNFADKHFRLPGENYFETMTPVFRYENVFNEHASFEAGEAKYDLMPVVEVRFAATPNYKPVFPVDSTYRTMANGRVITWAERFAANYAAFLAGETQHASGTPLEELKGFGITPAQLSICRALNVMSIEALDQLEGAGLKRLGAHGNELKPMARRWMEARAVAGVMDNRSEIDQLKAELAALKAGAQAPAANDAYSEYSDTQIKDEIEKATGARPKGNPSRATLVSMLETALAA